MASKAIKKGGALASLLLANNRALAGDAKQLLNLEEILNRSPFGDEKLRDEAVYFIKTRVEELGFDSMENVVDRSLLKSILRHYEFWS